MTTSALRIFGTTAVLALGLCSCSGPDSSQETAAVTSGAAQAAASDGAPSGGAAAVSPLAQPSPSEPRKYTAGELAALLGQLSDAGGTPFSVMSEPDLAAAVKQSAELLAAMTVEPEACSDLVLSGPAPSPEGAAAAAAVGVNEAAGTSASVSMSSGLDQAVLAAAMAQSGELDKCASAEATTGGTKVSLNLTRLEGLGTVQPMIAYRTDTEVAGGSRQSMITGQVVHRGVLISVITSGGASQEEAVSRAGGLLDQAVGLLGK